MSFSLASLGFGFDLELNHSSAKCCTTGAEVLVCDTWVLLGGLAVVSREPVPHSGYLRQWQFMEAAVPLLIGTFRGRRTSVWSLSCIVSLSWTCFSKVAPLFLSFLCTEIFGSHMFESDEQKLPNPQPYFQHHSVTAWFSCPGQTILFSWLHQSSWAQLVPPVLKLLPADAFCFSAWAGGGREDKAPQAVTNMCHTHCCFHKETRTFSNSSNVVWLIQPGGMWWVQGKTEGTITSWRCFWRREDWENALEA